MSRHTTMSHCHTGDVKRAVHDATARASSAATASSGAAGSHDARPHDTTQAAPHAGAETDRSDWWRGSVIQQLGLSGLDAAIVGLAALLAVAWLPIFTFPTTPRLILLVLAGVPGLVLLGISAWRRDLASVFLVAFVAAAVVSAFRSPDVWYSLKGTVGSATSVLLYTLVAGCWALGRALSDPGRRLLPWALLAGFALNAVVAFFQVVLEVDSGRLASLGGRGSGLLINPVYYGALGAGVTCWAIYRSTHVAGWRPAAFVAGLVFLTDLSQSRVAAAAIVVVAVVMLIAVRSRASLLTVGAVGVGLLASNVFNDLVNAGSRSTLSRTASVGSDGRLDIWRFGLEAFADRPLFGWGLGHFGSATWSRFTPEFVRSSRWDDTLQEWDDPHNLLVLLLAGVGIVGVALLVAFVGASLRRCVRRDLLAFSFGVAATWAFQPARVETLPIALLVFGASVAAVRTADEPRPGEDTPQPRLVERRSVQGVMSAGLVVGLVAAGVLAVSEYRLRAAARADDLAALESAAGWFPHDYLVADYVSSQYAIADDVPGVDEAAETVAWSRRVAEIAPWRPRSHTDLAVNLFYAGDLDGMKLALDDAFVAQRWNPAAHRITIVYADLVDDDELFAATIADACMLELAVCDRAAEAGIDVDLP